ncbi:MAG: fatty acid amide hydrolase [Pirellulaceae bacterium]|jgi:fatty acid amide hydrolase
MSTAREITEHEILSAGAAQLASWIRERKISSRRVTECFIDRTKATHDRLNAVIAPRFEQALAVADQRDRQVEQAEIVGLLHGVPFTVKECFHVQGMDSTIGLTHRVGHPETETGVLVRRLETAGGVLLGKTNVPQMMLWHECDNPVYGCTNNPWDLSRTPGGSTGGEGAIVAAAGSPLGLGNDLGGSIRLPAHFCGIHGIKPTNHRLPRSGTFRNFRGLEAMVTQAGPLSRHVDDLILGLKVLGEGDATQHDDVSPVPLGDAGTVDVTSLRIGIYDDDGYFSAAPSLRRLVGEASSVLRDAGVSVKTVDPYRTREMVEIYFGIMTADSGADLHRIAKGSELDRRTAHLLRLAKMPRWLRKTIGGALKLQGQQRFAQLLTMGGRCSADEYWQLTDRLNRYRAGLSMYLEQQQVDLLMLPPHALPAMKHRLPLDLIDAASYSLLANVSGFPAGVVSLSKVRPGEESDRSDSRDTVIKKAQRAEQNSTGLPIGVQVVGRMWQEHQVLAVMKLLESKFRLREDYPSEIPLS